MFNFKRIGIRLGLLITIVGIANRSVAGDNAAAKPLKSVELGISESLFQGVPKEFRSGASDSFLKLMNECTGIQGNLHFAPDAMLLAKQMDEGKVQIALFQGHEFAWAKAKYPDLTAVAVAVPLQPVQSFCLVRFDCPAKNIGELTKEKISLPPTHRAFSDMFLAKQKEEHLRGADFAGRVEAESATDAIFDVIESKSGCTIVDRSTLKFFETVNPGAYKNLRILCQSEVFPNACIAVKKGALDANTIEMFRKSLLNVQNVAGGKNLLMSWKLRGFSNVPDDYEQGFKKILKEYPVPATTAVNK